MTDPGMTHRRETVTCYVGGVPIGSAHPVVVQSMTNTDTADAEGTALQVAQLYRAGSEIVRITVNNKAAAQAVPEIKARLLAQGLDVPLVGDFHFNGHVLLREFPQTAAALDKYRINPGNVGTGKRHDENFVTMIGVAKEFDKPVRIGVNWGSLDAQLLTKLMDENAASAAPKDARDVMIEAMLAVCACSPLNSPKRMDWVTTRSSCPPKSRTPATSGRSTGCSRPAATIRCIWG